MGMRAMPGLDTAGADGSSARADQVREPLVSVVLPTYQEKDNIGPLIARIRSAIADLHEIIVVDDDSPDETWRVVQELSYHNVRVIRRTNERGLTSALRDGIAASTGNIVVWMDCDLSMPPEAIPSLLTQILLGQDVAVGSRYVSGGADARDVRFHKLLSWVICRAARLALGGSFRDYTSGFIAVRKSCLTGFAWDDDYGEYFIVLIYYLRQRGARIVEVPYTLVSRASGESKTATNPLGFLVRGRKYVSTIWRLRFGNVI
jgi:dolichol-phosphate mannosyltransferase